MDVLLKNIKFSEALSEETNAFTANLYYKGRKCGYVKNEGHGGNTLVQSYPETKKIFENCVEYCNSLPPYTYDFNGREITFNQDIELVVDNLFEEWLRNKERKRMEKRMKTCLIWGIPNGSHYKSVNFKKPLNTIDREVLQSYINRYKESFEDGEVYLNTNLDEFNL